LGSIQKHAGSLSNAHLKQISMKFTNRNLGAIEKVFWLLDQVSQVHFAFAAEIDAVRNENEWQSAIDATQMRHPLLSAKIAGDNETQPFFDFSDKKKIPVRFVEGLDDTRWLSEIETELSVPFDWSTAPLLRVVIVQYQNRSVIVIAAHHCIADGVGLSLVIRDIVAALAGQPLGTLPPPMSADEYLNLAKPMRHDGEKHASGTTSIQRKAEIRPQVFQQVLSESLTEQIVNKVKAEKSTVNAVLSAALVLAGKKLSETWKHNEVRLVVPVSIRQALQIGEDCGLFITKKTINFQPNELVLWSLANKINKEIAEINTLGSIAAETEGIRQFIFSPMDITDISDILQNDVGREIMVSNIGRINYNTQTGKIKINSLWGPIALSGSIGDQTVGISTINGKMHLLHVSRIPIPALLETTVDILQELLN